MPYRQPNTEISADGHLWEECYSPKTQYLKCSFCGTHWIPSGPLPGKCEYGIYSTEELKGMLKGFNG